MKMRIIQAPGALPTLRADGAAVIATQHEVLVRFYFDAPPYPDEADESLDEPRAWVREIVASISLSPEGAHALHETLESLADDG
jgi:hypothetical protein